MRIGLVRHFRVHCPHKTFMTSSEFAHWAKEYEQAMVHITPVELNGVQWDICYVSNLPRAITTANEIFHGPSRIEPLLREVGTAPFTTKDQIKLPFGLWHVFARVAWFLGKDSQPETRKETRKRIRTFLSKVDWSNDNILIVSHAFTLYNMQHELRRLGFRGRRVSRVRNGVLYEFVFDGKGKQVRRWRKQCIRKKHEDVMNQ